MKEKDVEYIKLDSSYDDMARDFAELVRQHSKASKKIEEIKGELDILYNRLTLYCKNEFFNKYSSKKHSFIIEKDTIYFYKEKDLKRAKQRYEDYVNDTYDFDQEFEEMYNMDFMDIDELAQQDNKNYHKMVNFLIKNLGKPEYKCQINAKQKNSLNNIIRSCLNVEEKHNYMKQRISDLEADYTDCLNEILHQIQDDDNYEFDYEKDELVSVKDVKTGSWHLIYYPRVNSDTLNKLLN